MAETGARPSLEELDEFLETRHIVKPGFCRYCEVPEDVRELIHQRVHLRAWTAFAKKLNEWGYDKIKAETIKQHYSRGHDDINR